MERFVVHPGGVRTDIVLNARSGGTTPFAARRFTETALRLPPEEAARQIVAAIPRPAAALVIARAARAADRPARLPPARYWAIISSSSTPGASRPGDRDSTRPDRGSPR